MGSSSPLQAETLEDYPASGPCRPHLCRCAKQQLSALRGQPQCPRETEAVTGAGDPRLPPTLSVGREAGHLAGGGRGGGDSFLLSLPSPPPQVSGCLGPPCRSLESMQVFRLGSKQPCPLRTLEP